MAGILKSSKVLYKCSCNEKRPITKIYFCRHCTELRCSDCVSHEVDSHYCPNCLEYMPSPEARLKKNRCANCFDCPSCMHTLSIRASNIQVVNPEDPNKTTPKKVYYLVCGFCRWSSRDVGISDQTVATGSWPDPENAYVKRISQLLEYYRAMAQQEKLDKERRKIVQRSGYANFSDRFGSFGISAIVAKKLAGLSTSSNYKEDENKMEEPAPSQAFEETEIFDESILTKPVNLVTISTIKQRFIQPEFQPSSTMDFYPRHKSLLIKKSQRCKQCEHNLSKPEFNPSSIKFKIQLTAFFHIVELRIKKVPKLVLNEPAKVILTLCNPTNHVAHVSFQDLEDENQSGHIEMPKCEFAILARDDTAEFDEVQDSGMGQRYDPNIVNFQKGNKIGFYATVTPKKANRDVIVGINLKQDFVNVVVQLQTQDQHRDTHVVWLNHSIWLNFGPVF